MCVCVYIWIHKLYLYIYVKTYTVTYNSSLARIIYADTSHLVSYVNKSKFILNFSHGENHNWRFNLIHKFKIVPIFLWMVAFSIIMIILFCRWTYFFVFWCIFGRNTQKHFVSFNSYLQIFILEPSFAHDFWLNGAVSLLNKLLFALAVDINSIYLQKTLSQKKINVVITKIITSNNSK